jgi:hypothetical protein
MGAMEMKRDGKTEAWRELSKKFIDGKIILREYLSTALEIGLLLPYEYDKEKTRYQRLNYNFNESIRATGLLKDEKPKK